MNKVNFKNERVKREYFRYLKYAGRCCASTVNNHETAISAWDDFTNNEDFGAFNQDKAIDFMDWLLSRGPNGRPPALSTYRSYVRHLRRFFGWLSQQKEYRNHVNANDVAFLRISFKQDRMAQQTNPRSYPTNIDYVRKMIDAIVCRNEIDQRDRALISFTLLSGMRDHAIVTLPLGCFDPETWIIFQDPKQGVQTKFSNLYPTSLFPFDKAMLDYVVEWSKYLVKKGFGARDPFFPRAKMSPMTNEAAFETATEVEPVFWKGTGRIREIFKSRSQKAGLRYYPPHTFRHLAVDLAFQAYNLEELKAISQNLGHKHIATTLGSYATYTPQKLSEIVKRMTGRLSGNNGSK